ncbi:GIY-YIG nuclease family protein [Pseudomarimonas arenosa]|nr:GIY-YIG nuclease family protein [Pseudomarimonas arenosa]
MYILRCADGSFYTGSTWNLEQRLWRHEHEGGARFVAKRRPFELVYVEETDSIEEAFLREKQIQGWSRRKKLALIDGQHDQLPTLAKFRSAPGHD